ncbi:MAG TPA: UDP-N-acetylmuramoyl-tripeptide--D-alanyl-D-alanine ligase [Bacteroidales bacterium]|nr:UDP-N-acetylmuramoyl-tripeptide--D-alanyl-D-alanine ligase [Bacteroidales bacterium]HSA43185.1 UDP-N-acetylmuramoyl-tripeptide--D-alanyl-D-alanine ligase [Bacteroidales bacterium]
MVSVPLSTLHALFLNYPSVSTDSRHIHPGSLFFAFRGTHFNGNLFAAEALEKGAAYAIVDENVPNPEDKRIIRVANVLETLQQMARFHRQQSLIPLLGITGSNGKTTSKELISAVLGCKYQLVATEGNLNNHIGVPLTLLRIGRDTEMAVVEMGANHPGEIGMLCNLALPDAGLITNIGKAHLEGFGGIDGIIRTKKALYDSVKEKGGNFFVNADDPLLMELTKDYPGRITYGNGRQTYCRFMPEAYGPFAAVTFSTANETHLVRSRLIGQYNLANLMAAITIGLHYGVEAAAIAAALETYEPCNQRSQFIQTSRNSVIMDAYNANPASMKASLESFAGIAAENKMLILGDMLELGDHAEEEHRQIIRWLEERAGWKVLLAGPVFSAAAKRAGFQTFRDAASVRDYLFQYPVRDHTILIKGSRGIKLETVLEAL